MRYLLLLFSFLATVLALPGGAAERLPNIVLIFPDDQGFADVGVFGSEQFGFSTPNIDRMAVEGMKFTDFYSVSSVCTPSRAGLLTGSYPPRTGSTRVLFPHSDVGLNPDEVTVADLLKQGGYATALIGKWHLGHHPQFLPTRQGFDYFWGIPYSNDMWIDPRARLAETVVLHDGATEEWIREGTPEDRRRRNDIPLMINEEVVEYPLDQRQLTQRSTEEALRFIRENQARPFFLYLPYVMPHIPLFASENFLGTTERGLYGDVIEELDWSVGQVMRTLQELGLDEDTLVIFTTDNGPWNLRGGQGGHADPLRGYKFDVLEGGMRVPTVMRWPGRIPPGTIQTEVAATIDILPTLAHLAGLELPSDLMIDGKNIWPLMSGQAGHRSPHEAFYYYAANSPRLGAVREGHWKYHAAHGDHPERLYNLAIDLGEAHDLAPTYREVAARLRETMARFDADLKANARPQGRLEP
jgi:arylsulfatase A